MPHYLILCIKSFFLCIMDTSLVWCKLDLDVRDCFAVIELITLGCVVRLLL